MSNYIECDNRIAFHPGYYIKEIIDESGLTQKEFAARLDTTPKNLSILVRGEQSLSLDIAMKLARMLGTSVEYWLNLQMSYDALLAEFQYKSELEREKRIFKYLEYAYFSNKFGLPELNDIADNQIKAIREFLNISSLSVIQRPDLTFDFCKNEEVKNKKAIICSNAMIQIAINKALSVEAPRYDKKKFQKAVEYVLTLTDDNEDFYPLIENAFKEAGVILLVLPDLDGAVISAVTKKVGKNIMLMVNDKRLFSDTFWFTLFGEINHIINGNFGVTFDDEEVDMYAVKRLIPEEDYNSFVKEQVFEEESIRQFAKKIGRTPGIVLGCLTNDKIIDKDKSILMNSLRCRYNVGVAC